MRNTLKMLQFYRLELIQISYLHGLGILTSAPVVILLLKRFCIYFVCVVV